MDSLPQLPPDVDPALKRVPGMSIDFADYRERARRIQELASLATAGEGAPDDPAFDEMLRLFNEQVAHDRAYSAWLQSRIDAQLARINRGAWYLLPLVLLVSAALVYLGMRLRRG